MNNIEEQRFDQLLARRQVHLPRPDIDAWLAEDETETYDRIVRMRTRRRRIAYWASAAAVLVVGWLVFFGYNGQNGHDEGSANESALAQETKETLLPAPLRGGVEGGVVKGTAPASSDTESRSYPTPSLKGAGSILPDTLGDTVWQKEENMLLALEMLEDCEAAIQRGERMVRNDIIEATYRATPQSPHAILVSNEAGESEVIEQPTTIEI